MTLDPIATAVIGVPTIDAPTRFSLGSGAV